MERELSRISPQSLFLAPGPACCASGGVLDAPPRIARRYLPAQLRVIGCGLLRGQFLQAGGTGSTTPGPSRAGGYRLGRISISTGTISAMTKIPRKRRGVLISKIPVRAGLRRLPDSEHLSGADWAYTLSGRAPILHRDRLWVAHLPLGPALHTIRFQDTPPKL